MIFREAHINDIRQMQSVRNSVTENRLSDPGLITDDDCKEFIINRGKGWVCDIDQQIVGFAIVDIKENNVWALFLRPEYEGQGIGMQLQYMMLDWYFSKNKNRAWLSTAPGTRAYSFYRKSGWTEVGIHGKGEIKFEMTRDEWINRRKHFKDQRAISAAGSLRQDLKH